MPTISVTSRGACVPICRQVEPRPIRHCARPSISPASPENTTQGSSTAPCGPTHATKNSKTPSLRYAIAIEPRITPL